MSAGLDLCQGQGLVILSKSPERRMLGGQSQLLSVPGALVCASESVADGELMPGTIYSPTTCSFKCFHN